MLKIHVDGNASGGYVVDIADGDKHGVYQPAAGSDVEALVMALKEHLPDADLGADSAALKAQVEHLTAELADAKKTLHDAEAEIMKSTPAQRSAALQELTPPAIPAVPVT